MTVSNACELVQMVARFIYAAETMEQYQEVKFGCDCGCGGDVLMPFWKDDNATFDTAAADLAAFCAAHGIAYDLGPCLALGCDFDWETVMGEKGR